MNIRDEVGRTFLLLAALDIAAKAVSFAATVLMVRHYGENGFGRIALAQSLVAYGLLCGGGLDVYAVRTLASDRRRLRSLASTVVLLRSIAGAAACGLLIALAALVPAWRESIGLVSLFGLTLFSSAISLVWVARATESFAVVGLAGLLQPILFVGLWLCFLRDAALWHVPVAAFLSESLVVGGVYIWVRRRLGPLERPLSLQNSCRLFRDAAPVGAAQIVRAIALGSDLVLLGLFVSFHDVGLYACAHRVFAAGISLATAYCVILLPRLSRAAAQSNWHLSAELSGSLGRTVLPALAAALAGIGLAKPLLTVLFGATAAPAEGALQVLTIVLFVFVLNAHTRTTLLAMGRQRENLGHVGVSAVVHVLAKLVLIPIMGIAGAALGTLIGETVLLLLGGAAIRRHLQGPAPHPAPQRTAEVALN